MKDLKRPVLMIEDSDEDFEITVAAMRQSGLTTPLIRCSTGRQAMDFIHQRGAYTLAEEPLFILIDLNIPGIDGRQILAELRKSPWLSAVPAIVLSTSSNPRDIRLCYQVGAAGYLVKPVNLDRFEEMIDGLARYWMDIVALPDQQELGHAGANI